jgi:uncharacterized protein involved in exopolysaccharide biosynthesis
MAARLQETNLSDEISLGELLRIARASYLMIGSITLAAVVLATATAFFMTPIYRSTALLAPVSDESQGAGLASGQLADLAALSGITVGTSGKQEAIALLKSRVLLEQFIQDQKLLPILFAEDWDSEQKIWTVEEEDVPTLRDAYDYFDEDIRRVEEDRKTGLVRLSIEWKDREQSALWANKLVALVNQYTRQRAIAEAEKSLEYLNRELARTGIVGIQQVLYRLVETEIKNIMLANVREQYSFRVIDPPAVSDPDGYAKPKRALIVLLGLLLGAVGGFIAALVDHSLRAQPKRVEAQD